MDMHRKHVKIAVVLLALFGTLFSTAQASAQPAGEIGTAGTVINMAPVPANGRVNCFGYYGTFRTGTYVMVVDWVTSTQECFGIAPDRTIWHTWPGAGGWKVMPGNGRADHMYTKIREWDNGARTIRVFVASGSYWCQDYRPGIAWDGDWYRCEP
jgi:hypothetical protein